MDINNISVSHLLICLFREECEYALSFDGLHWFLLVCTGSGCESYSLFKKGKL